MHANEDENKSNATIVFNNASWHRSAFTDSLQFQSLIISCLVVITILALPLNFLTVVALARRAGLASIRTTLFINLIVIDMLLTAVIAILPLLEWVYQVEDLSSRPKWRIKTPPRLFPTQVTSYLGTANNYTLAWIALFRYLLERNKGKEGTITRLKPTDANSNRGNRFKKLLIILSIWVWTLIVSLPITLLHLYSSNTTRIDSKSPSQLVGSYIYPGVALIVVPIFCPVVLELVTIQLTIRKYNDRMRRMEARRSQRLSSVAHLAFRVSNPSKSTARMQSRRSRSTPSEAILSKPSRQPTAQSLGTEKKAMVTATALEIVSMMAWLLFTSGNPKTSLILVEQMESDWFLLTWLGCMLTAVVNPLAILAGDSKARLHIQRLLRVFLCRKVVVKPEDSLDCLTTEFPMDVGNLASKRFQPGRIALLSVVEQSKPNLQQCDTVRARSTPDASLLHKVSFIPESIWTSSVATK